MSVHLLKLRLHLTLESDNLSAHHMCIISLSHPPPPRPLQHQEGAHALPWQPYSFFFHSSFLYFLC